MITVDNLNEFIVHSYKNIRMTCKEVSNSLKSKGISLSESGVYGRLKKLSIVRNNSEAKLNRNKFCDYKTSFLNNSLLEIIDGFLLGDGSAQKHIIAARFAMSTSSEEFCNYWKKSFCMYDPISFCQKINNPRYNGEKIQFSMLTKSHPDITFQRSRWYKNNKKVIPNDVIITPLSVSLWFCGDGTRAVSDNSQWGTICTQDFSSHDVEFLVEKLCKLQIICHRVKNNTIYITAHGLPKLLQYMGSCPIPYYNYKFVDHYIKLKNITKDN